MAEETFLKIGDRVVCVKPDSDMSRRVIRKIKNRYGSGPYRVREVRIDDEDVLVRIGATKRSQAIHACWLAKV